MTRKFLFAALGAALVLSSAPMAQAVVACQKTSNPDKIKLRANACKQGKETEVALTASAASPAATFDDSPLPLPHQTWVQVSSLFVPKGDISVRATARIQIHDTTGASVANVVQCELRYRDQIVDNSILRVTHPTAFFGDVVDITLGGLVDAQSLSGPFPLPPMVSLWCYGAGDYDAEVDRAHMEALPM